MIIYVHMTLFQQDLSQTIPCLLFQCVTRWWATMVNWWVDTVSVRPPVYVTLFSFTPHCSQWSLQVNQLEPAFVGICQCWQK